MTNGQPERRTIKVKVVLSVEVDVETYRANYGDESIASIRRDVAWDAVR